MPIIWSEKIDKNGELAVWHITETAEELYHQLQLNESEKNYLETLQKSKRHLHWLGSRVLLRTLLNTTEFIDCRLDENNKPYLFELPYQISLSHSNDYAAVIIYKERKVGIDIEKMSEKIERIAERVMSKNELAFISTEERIKHLYACWGAKETLFKLYGKGNLPFIDGIQINEFKIAEGGTITAKINKSDALSRYRIEYHQLGGYMLTWCIE